MIYLCSCGSFLQASSAFSSRFPKIMARCPLWNGSTDGINTLEACRKLPQEQRYIVLEATYIKEMLQICIKNGSPEKLKKDSSGRYLTTKKDTGCHGIGLASVEQALADYDGELFTQYENGEFRASAVLYSNSIEEK